MGRGNVDVGPAVHEELKTLKNELGLKTTGDVVKMLLDVYRGRSSPAGSDEYDGGPRPMEDDEDRARKKVQLISFDVLSEEAKAIKYFTGLNDSCMTWVMNAMCDAVRLSSCFRQCRILGQRLIERLRAQRFLMCLWLTLPFGSSRRGS